MSKEATTSDIYFFCCYANDLIYWKYAGIFQNNIYENITWVVNDNFF